MKPFSKFEVILMRTSYSKHDLFRNLNIFSQAKFFQIKTMKKHLKILKITKYINLKSCT